MTTSSAPQISVAFATTLDTPEHVELAEQLGFARAWLYDTPQQSPDVWMCLALAAQRTSSIGLGPGVLVPTLRHPMVNAAATAALERLAPSRVAVGFGTGHTGRRAMGQPKPIPWSYMSRYITAFRHLLEVRQVLEVGAARLAAPRISDEALASLQELADEAAAALPDAERYLQLDYEIHTAIIEATGNPIYISLYESIAELSLESRKRTARTTSVRQRAHDDHVAIITALSTRDPDSVAQAMSAHLDAMRGALDTDETAEETEMVR